MKTAINNFRANMLRVRSLGGLYQAIMSLTTRAIDPSDLLRAQIVLGVSALDHYVHEVTLLGMLEIVDGKRAPTQSFLQFRVPMDSVLGVGKPPTTRAWLEMEVRERHGFHSFQRPDKIAEAIRLVSGVRLWEVVSTKLGMTDRDVRDQLALITERRNKIAHEADADPSYPGARWPIAEKDVENALAFLEKLCEAIHSSLV